MSNYKWYVSCKLIDLCLCLMIIFLFERKLGLFSSSRLYTQLVATCNFAVHLLVPLCCAVIVITPWGVAIDGWTWAIVIDLWERKVSPSIHVHRAGNQVLDNSSIMESTSQLPVQTIVQSQSVNCMVVYCLLKSAQLLEPFWNCFWEIF